MLQWYRDGFCPNIETVVNDGILRFDKNIQYSKSNLLKIMAEKYCEPLTPEEEKSIKKEFKLRPKISGKEMIKLLNMRFRLKKKRLMGNDTIVFSVMAAEKKPTDDDEQLSADLPRIRAIYQMRNKDPSHFVYLGKFCMLYYNEVFQSFTADKKCFRVVFIPLPVANASMAFSSYHDKLRQIGADPQSYVSWVNEAALKNGLARLQSLMESVPCVSNEKNTRGIKRNSNILDHSTFERELRFEFDDEEIICEANNNRKVVGVAGVCDWVGRGLKTDKDEDIDLLEIKFVQQLTNQHRLQVLVYCALLAMEEGRACRGLLYNARSEERVVCLMPDSCARDFLLDISQFKFNGQRRFFNPPQALKAVDLLKTDINRTVFVETGTLGHLSGSESNPITLN